MLDENLPTFYLRASTDNVKHNASILYSHLGSDATPEYSLRHPDPTSQASRNRYAAALYDSYSPDILYAEVLLTPEWSQHKASAEEVRMNGGVPPAPHPVLPTEFVIQLYNPDQQIHVRYHASTWTSGAYWEFEMPQQSFRQPSVSAIDRVQDDPTASDNTPKLEFKWKKEGKLSKDYTCLLSEKSTNPDGSKRKNREPDITLAIFRNYKEITVYEPNLNRVDIEDPKGFEVVLLLGAVVIREVYNSSLAEAFNISDAPPSNPISPILNPLKPRFSPPANTTAHNIPSSNTPGDSRPPPTDARTQWELDAEAAALKKQLSREQAEQRRLDAAETKRVQRMLADEERRDRERQKEIDRETERLKKIYGKEERKSLQQLQAQKQQGGQQQGQQRPPPLPDRHSIHGSPQPYYPQPGPQQQQYPPPRPHSAIGHPGAPYIAHNLRPQGQQAQNLAPPASFGLPPQMTGALASGSSQGPPQQVQQQQPVKKPFWRRGGSDEQGGSGSGRLQKQRSTVF